MTGTGRTIARAAAGIAVVTVAARAVGLLRYAVFARAVGPTSLGNTYQTANTLPNVVFEIVAGGALASLVVPVVAGAAERGDAAAVRRTTAALLTWTVALLLPMALVGALLREPLMAALVRGVEDPELRRAEVTVGARMLVVFMPQVVLYGLGVVLTGVLQAHRRFLAPALAPLLSSLVVIGAYALFAARAGRGAALTGLDRTDELVLSVGTTLGVVALTLPLLVPAARLGVLRGLRPTWRLPDGAGPRVRRLAAAAVAAVAAQQVFQLVVLRLTNPQPGAVVLYTLAWTVYLLPWAVLAVPVATSAFPALAAAYDGGDEPAYARTAATTLRAVVAVTGLAAAVLAATAVPVSALVLGVQHVAGAAPAAVLPRGVVAFAPGLVGYGVLALLTRALYARDQARDAAVATVAGFALAAVAGVVLVGLVEEGAFGLSADLDRVAALGAANTLGMTLAGALLVRALRRHAGSGATTGAARTTLVALVAAVAAAPAGWLVLRALPDVEPAYAGALLGAVVSGLASAAVWLGVAAAARLPEVSAGWARLVHRG